MPYLYGASGPSAPLTLCSCDIITEKVYCIMLLALPPLPPLHSLFQGNFLYCGNADCNKFCNTFIKVAPYCFKPNIIDTI